MWENNCRKNYKYEHFPRSLYYKHRVKKNSATFLEARCIERNKNSLLINYELVRWNCDTRISTKKVKSHDAAIKVCIRKMNNEKKYIHLFAYTFLRFIFQALIISYK